MARKLSTTKIQEGTRFSRRVATRDHSLPKLNPNKHKSFVLAWHPERWDVIDGELSPIFRKFTDRAGLQGLTEGQRIETLASQIESNLGWRFIQEEEGLEYLVKHQTAYGSEACLASWEKPVAGGSKVIFDTAEFNAFIDNAIECGAIVMPNVEKIETMLSDIRTAYEKLMQRHNGMETSQSQLLQSKIEVLENLIKEAFEAQKPAPKKTSTRKKAITNE